MPDKKDEIFFINLRKGYQINIRRGKFEDL